MYSYEFSWEGDVLTWNLAKSKEVREETRENQAYFGLRRYRL